jgi:Flp pilus assembly protein TadG
LIFGMIVYAVFFGTAHSVQELAADAARVAVAGVSDAERQQLVQNYIANNGGGYAFIDPTKLTSSAGTSLTDANQIAVSVTYDSTGFPLWTLLPSNLLPDPKITRRVSIRMGGI